MAVVCACAELALDSTHGREEEEDDDDDDEHKGVLKPSMTRHDTYKSDRSWTCTTRHTLSSGVMT
jgi:hypothetical protein